MTEMKNNFNHVEAFKKGFESRCIRLIIYAYQLAVKEKAVSFDWDENDITDTLNEYMDVNPARLNWEISTNVEHRIHNKNSINEKGFSATFSRIDMRFSTFKSKLEYRYFMEAKNLKENDSQLKRRYIDTGIDSFIRGKYPNFFLAGYLLEGDLSRTVDGVNKLLKKDKRENEILNKRDYKYHDRYYESVHSGACVLKHIMLDFTKQ